MNSSSPDTTQASCQGPFRYGLVGTGSMGRGHIGAVNAIRNAEIVALADPCADSLAAARAALPDTVRIYTGYAELLAAEQDLDAVIVATPDATHADLVIAMLGAGRHVLSEKPMATTIADCNRIAAAATASDAVYQVGLELRYLAIWQRLREQIDSGRIGRVRQLWCKEFRGPWAQKVDQWITQKSMSGGTLVEKNCHHFDLFNWYADAAAVRVAGFGSCDLVYGKERFGVTPDVLDSAHVIVEYDSGAVATLLLCMYCTGYRDGLELGVVGTDGWMIATAFGEETDSLRIAGRDSGEETVIRFRLPDEIREISHGGAVYYEHLAFQDNVRRRREALTGVQAGWGSTVVGLAAERAVAEKRVVEIADFGAPPARY